MHCIEEYFDEVDYNGNVIASHPKSYFKKRMFLHRVSLIIPIAQNKKVVISKRAKDKHPYPNAWVCAVGGKARSGESDEDAAIREMKEEIGIEYPIKKVASFVYDEKDYKAIFSIFTTTIPVSISDFELDKREIQYSKEFTIDELMVMLKDDPSQFAPTFMKAITELKKHQG